MAKATKSKSKTGDLFDTGQPAAQGPPAPRPAKPRAAARESAYTARDIEVLEGLEPVRRRPGMYIGGTDEKALHHLFAEVIDNSMDEALAGHATFIDVEMEADGYITVTDNGRGIPVDPHPKFKNKSALEVIMTTLHAGGKFDSKVYETSGGLHGVGVSVANALSDRLEVEVWREQQHYRMVFERGKPKGKLEKLGRVPNKRGTKVRFHPDPQIFGPKAGVQAAARIQDGALEGLSLRRRRDPLELRQGIVARRRGRARAGDVPLPRRPEGLSRRRHPQRHAGASGHLHRQVGQHRQPWRGRMGGRLDRRCRRLRLLLLQHHPDRRRRHA